MSVYIVRLDDEYFCDADKCCEMWCNNRKHAFRFEERSSAVKITAEYGGKVVRLVPRTSDAQGGTR